MNEENRETPNTSPADSHENGGSSSAIPAHLGDLNDI